MLQILGGKANFTDWTRTLTKILSRGFLSCVQTRETRSNTGEMQDLQEWDLCVGPVLVVRQDGKEITTHQVEALVAWGRHIKNEMEGELEPDSEY